MTADYEDDIISEGAEYSPKSEFSKPKVAEDAVRKCIEARGKEMIQGYFNYSFSQDGTPMKTWVPDSRMVYDACVNVLRNLLSPEIKQNETFKDVEKNIRERKEELLNKYGYQELVPELNELGQVTYKATGNKYIPRVGDTVMVKKVNPQGKLTASEVVGGWNQKTNFYQDELIKLNDYLFGALNELIDSLNYFKQKVSF